MRRTNKPQKKPKLLVSVENVRSLDAKQMKEVLGGACPRSKPVLPDVDD